MDSLAAFSSFGIAGLVVVALLLVARWYMPIAEKNAVARATHFAAIAQTMHELLLLHTAWHAEYQTKEHKDGQSSSSSRSGDI
jgi:hypothetical protein